MEVARELARSPHGACRRTVAGRACYALMLEVRGWLDRWGIACPPRDKVHSFVRLSLLCSADPGLKQIGLTLKRLSRIRNDADCKVMISAHRFLGPGLVENAIQDAGRAIAIS